MSKLSRPLGLLLLAGAWALSGCTRAPESGVGTNVRGQLAEGREATSQWNAAARRDATPDAETAIALGYLERLRLGLGSPFRLVDFALRDPRLADTTRTRLAWALLGRIAAGQAYEIDPITMEGASEPAGGRRARGNEHVRLIQAAIRESSDPRAGELAVRLGYALAAAEGVLTPHTPRVAARVAALTRDRELARADARALLDSARVSGTDALVLLRQLRAKRAFRVEAPALAPMPNTVERQALELAPRLAGALRELTLRNRSDDGLLPARASLITPRTALVLLGAADSLGMPPLAPVTVAARGYYQELLSASGIGEEELVRRRAFSHASSEEELVARHALLTRVHPLDGAPALAMLWAAAGLRPLAQEEVWFPGQGGPSNRELMERFGLGGVSFAETVPAAWRPYYRRMLEIAIADMQLVLPALDVRGLRVHFDPAPRQEGTLALHDPQKRRLILPPTSAVGTIAHEIAHDLDWQVALRRYHVRGDYATDRATRTARSRASDPLALRLQDLYAGVTLPAGASERTAAHARRPAEVFARNIDWFVTAALASQGRMNGYLSSVQDELLTGYGTVRPPELSGTAGDALIRILDVVAPVYPDTRSWFLTHYGTGRGLRSYDLARRVLEAEVPATRNEPFAPERWQLGERSAFASVVSARDAGLRAVDDWTCRAPGGAYDEQLEAARRRIVLEAANARARGVALDRVRQLGDAEADRWLVRELYGAPFGTMDLSLEMSDFVAQLVEGVRRVEQAPVTDAQSGFVLRGGLVGDVCALRQGTG